MGYQFPLATVLRVRGIAEEQEERTLQKILLEISQVREAATRIDAEIAAAGLARTNHGDQLVTGYHLQLLYIEEKALKQAKAELEEKLIKLEEQRLAQIKVFENARRNREMLTDMHDNQLTEYEANIARSEQRTLDDNYIARRGRI